MHSDSSDNSSEGGVDATADTPVDPARRTVLKAAVGAGLSASVLAVAPLATLAAPAGNTSQATYLFFTADEAAFVEAALARLIPGDAQAPGAREAGVANYIDKMLGGAWGAGVRLYRSGPWQPGTPQQGYQLRFTPAELFRTACKGLATRDGSAGKKPFATLSAADQDAYLKHLETSNDDLAGVPAHTFFDHLLEWTVQGYFADPVYGGNRNMASWRLLGFPGAYASYYELVDKHGMKFQREPVSLAETPSGRIKVNPNIPPYFT